jgi:hypothetical protein
MGQHDKSPISPVRGIDSAALPQAAAFFNVPELFNSFHSGYDRVTAQYSGRVASLLVQKPSFMITTQRLAARWLTAQWLTARRLAMAVRRLTATTLRAEATEWQRQQRRPPSGRLRTPARFVFDFFSRASFFYQKNSRLQKKKQI